MKIFITLLATIFAAMLPCKSSGAEITKTNAATSEATVRTDRISCSSLIQSKQSTETAFKAMADIGYKWVDLSCLKWAPHVSVEKLLEDFDAEASRVEALLAANGLRVSNLTFDPVEARAFEQYEREFTALAQLAARLDARLINLMAPSLKSDRDEQVARLRQLQAIAAKHGILLTVETHCFQITERPADALQLCRDVPGLGLTLDPAHYYAGTNQGASFDALLPLTQGTGFRAGGMTWKEIQLPWGEGPIDFVKIVKNLEAVGYRGFYVCEYIERHNEVNAVEQARRFFDWAVRLSIKPMAQ
ncbi:MAG: sugar phosphate isomerase/epimerase [Verrucomicrobia bacterium]|nr:sugar phosphate isomerase/epimerase [Verrucomicrobiota bacterium]